MAADFSMMHVAVVFLFLVVFCTALKILVDHTKALPAENKRLYDEIDAVKAEVSALRIQIQAMTSSVKMGDLSLVLVTEPENCECVQETWTCEPLIENNTRTAPDIVQISSDDNKSVIESYLASRISAALSSQSGGRITASGASGMEKN